MKRCLFYSFRTRSELDWNERAAPECCPGLGWISGVVNPGRCPTRRPSNLPPCSICICLKERFQCTHIDSDVLISVLALILRDLRGTTEIHRDTGPSSRNGAAH